MNDGAASLTHVKLRRSITHQEVRSILRFLRFESVRCASAASDSDYFSAANLTPRQTNTTPVRRFSTSETALLLCTREEMIEAKWTKVRL